MADEFTGRTIVVTGAARGQGAAEAEILVREGARVIGADILDEEGAALAAIEAGMIVHSREYEGDLVRLVVSGPASLVGRLRKYRLRDE